MTHEARMNGTQADIVGASLGRVPWEQQEGPGHNPYNFCYVKVAKGSKQTCDELLHPK